MRSLNHKLVRDLWRLRGQIFAIAMVIGSGVAVLVMSLSTLEALRDTADAYYERYRFGEIFAGATRVPERLADRIADIPGVQFLQTRISRYAILDIDGFGEPVIGRLTSIPEHGQPELNQLVVRSGRWVTPHRHDEVIINEPFAEAHNIALGAQFSAIVNGRKRKLTVVGIALSPEFIYALGPGALLPDDKRFGVIWMGRTALAAAYDLDNAFNDLSVTLLRGIPPEPVSAAIDSLLEPYGGVSAVARADQLSNWFVMNEIEQIKTISTIIPSIFLCVAAFLSHMVLSRLITIERAEIGLLKAFGYANFEVAWHYIKFVIVIALIGSVIGWVIGGLFGRYNTQIYADLFRFPLLIYRPSGTAFLVAGSVSIVAMLIGALSAVRTAAALAPAEAMRPPSPVVYRRSSMGSAFFETYLDQPTRIALRQIGRWPMRALFTCAGIALAVGLLIMALQWDDSLDYIAQTFFADAQHQSMSVGLVEPQSLSVVREFEHLPGVMTVEPWRVVAVDFRVGTRRHRGSIVGVAATNGMQPIHDDATGEDIAVPSAGLVLGTYLAAKLAVQVGDEVYVEVLEGRRPAGSVPVADVFETTIGMPAMMDLSALNRWLKVRPTVEYLNLLVDSNKEAALFAELKEIPEVSAIMIRRAALDTFYDTIAKHMMVSVSIFTGFACALGFGVTYNSTRIALSERGRELASLRVLGFTQREVALILAGELAVLTWAALPVGAVLGYFLSALMVDLFDTDLYRLPFVIHPSTYGYAALLVLSASALSAWIVLRRVANLDLISVLKTRE